MADTTQPTAPADPAERTVHADAAPPHPGQSVWAVPPGVRIGSEWAARGLLIAAALVVLTLALRAVSEIVIPIAIAVLLAALLAPLNRRLRARVGNGPAAGLTLLVTILVVGGLLYLAGSQLASGATSMGDQLSAGIEQIRSWARSTFHINDSQLSHYIDQAKAKLESGGGDISSTAKTVGLKAGHFLAGFFICMFSLFFFLFEGTRIWAWVVRLGPRQARGRLVESGAIAWHALSAYVRAQVIVAAVDAVGITIGAFALRVPFPIPIGIIVFLSSFVPVVGALVSGAVAVVLALVAHGPGVALAMLGVVILVQQLEAHVLQPFLLGRSVDVHPVAVILAIAAGSIVAGIVGALTAVPLAAVANGVGKHLLSTSDADTPADTERQIEAALTSGRLAAESGAVGEGAASTDETSGAADD